MQLLLLSQLGHSNTVELRELAQHPLYTGMDEFTLSIQFTHSTYMVHMVEVADFRAIDVVSLLRAHQEQ